jgi:hypothetical protein
MTEIQNIHVTMETFSTKEDLEDLRLWTSDRLSLKANIDDTRAAFEMANAKVKAVENIVEDDIRKALKTKASKKDLKDLQIEISQKPNDVSIDAALGIAQVRCLSCNSMVTPKGGDKAKPAPEMQKAMDEHERDNIMENVNHLPPRVRPGTAPSRGRMNSNASSLSPSKSMESNRREEKKDAMRYGLTALDIAKDKFSTAAIDQAGYDARVEEPSTIENTDTSLNVSHGSQLAVVDLYFEKIDKNQPVATPQSVTNLKGDLVQRTSNSNIGPYFGDGAASKANKRPASAKARTSV